MSLLPEIPISAEMTLRRLIDSLRGWGREVSERALTRDYVWDDVFPSRLSTLGAGSTPVTQAYRDTPIRYEHLRHDQNTGYSVHYQMPHRWAGTPVIPHWHVFPCGPTTGVVVITGQYAWTKPGFELGPLATWTSFRREYTISDVEQYRETILSLGEVTPPSWARESAHLHIFWQRAGTDVLDTYDSSNPVGVPQANLAIISPDLHFQATKLGTETQFGAY